MGTLVCITCPCGYESEGFYVGCGFAGEEKGYELIQCRSCHRFCASGVMTKEKRCSHCRSRRVQVFEQELPAGPLTCLACGQPTAQAVECGLWD